MKDAFEQEIQIGDYVVCTRDNYSKMGILKCESFGHNNRLRGEIMIKEFDDYDSIIPTHRIFCIMPANAVMLVTKEFAEFHIVTERLKN